MPVCIVLDALRTVHKTSPSPCLQAQVIVVCDARRGQVEGKTTTTTCHAHINDMDCIVIIRNLGNIVITRRKPQDRFVATADEFEVFIAAKSGIPS